MATKTSNTSPFNPFDAYVNAFAFRKASIVLAGNNDGNFLMWPYMVNEIFSLELHIKSLHAIRSKSTRGHDIKRLFQELPRVDQDKIRSYLKQIIQNVSQDVILAAPGVSLELDDILERSQDTFACARYWHKGTLPSSDAMGNKSNGGVAPLIDAVTKRIYDLKPTWETKINNVKFRFGIAPPTT